MFNLKKHDFQWSSSWRHGGEAPKQEWTWKCKNCGKELVFNHDKLPQLSWFELRGCK